MDVLQTINFIRQDASTGYQERVPLATRDNITAVGNALETYPALKNEFLDALVNKVAVTLITATEFSNPFEQFKGEPINFGDTVEDIYIELPTAEQFAETVDGASVDPYTVTKSQIKVNYHSIDRKVTYTVTVQDDMLRQAFQSQAGLSSLVNQVVDQLYQAMAEDEFIYAKQMLSDETNVHGHIEDIGEVADSHTLVANVLAQIRALSSKMRFRSTAYNALAVQTRTPRSDQILVIREDVRQGIDMQVLAGIFNLEKVDIEQRIIEVDSFANVDQLAVLVDRKGLRIHDALKTTESQRNSKALYTNYFVHHWGLVSFSKYRNAVMIKGTVAPAV